MKLNLQKKLKYLKREAYTLYFACGDHHIPWYAKLLAICVVTYAFSPIDLIPDFIPVIGYLDDLLIVPLGVFLVSKLIPNEVMTAAREKAENAIAEGKDKPKSWIGAAIIVAIWLLIAGLGISLYFRNVNSNRK
ncbi:DUF1232 domain-containing protein (plasmid) [Pseudanabaena biceps]|nr:DUF1232 domain-containing protein [Pseudanabaena biceps]